MPTPIELLIKYAVDFKEAIAGTNQVDAKVEASAKKMAGSVDVAAKQMSTSTAKAAKEMANYMDQLSFRAIMVGNALTFKVTVPLMGLATAAMHAYMGMDSLTRGLTVVMGSSEAAASEMERLKEVAKLPGLGLKEAYQGSLNLQAVGMSATEARDGLMAFGNALAMVGKGKNELAAVQEQIMQIVSKGKVMTEDIRIIRSYVPQITQAMKAAFGTASVEEIAKAGVTGKEFVDRVVKELAKLPKMTVGVKNDMENVADSINQSLAKIGEDIAPSVSRILKAGTALLDVFTKLPPLIRYTAEGFAALAIPIGPVLSIIGQLVQMKLTLQLLRTQQLALIEVQNISTAAQNANTASTATAAGVKKILADAEAALAAETAASTTATNANTTAVRGNMLANSRLLGFFKTLPGAITAAIVGISALTYSVNRYTEAAVSAAKAAAELGDEWYQQNEQKTISRLSGKSDSFLKRQREIISQNITAERKKLQDLKEKGDWGKWFTSTLSSADILRAKTDVPLVEENIKRLEQQLETIDKMLKDRRSGKSAVENQLASMLKQAMEYKIAAARAAQLGDKAGEEWARINANYIKRLADNIKQAQTDPEFDKVAADTLALEEYRADKRRYLLKRQADMREAELTGILSALEKEEAVAKYYGDEIGAAKARAMREYKEAIARAFEVDSETGQYKYGEEVRRNKLEKATAEYWLSVEESIKEAKDKAKQKSLEALEAEKDYVSTFIEGARLDAEALKDASGVAVAEATRVWVEAVADARKAEIEGKPAELIRQVYENGRKRSLAILRAAAKEEADKFKEQARAEKIAGIQIEQLSYETTVSAMRAALERETDPETRLKMVAEIGEAGELAAQKSVLAELIEARAELNRLAEEGIDITKRADLIQAKANKTLAEAKENTQRLIQEEVDRQAEAVKSKIAEIRREDEERQRAYENETRRLKDMTRFTSGEDMWRKSILSGINAMWGVTPLSPTSDTSLRPTTDREAVRAIERLREEQDRTNYNLDQIYQVLNQRLGGRIGAFGR
jgi:tape measure domain-containing protein